MKWNAFLQHCIRNSQSYPVKIYLVKWLGYGLQLNTWKPNLIRILKVLKEYKKFVALLASDYHIMVLGIDTCKYYIHLKSTSSNARDKMSHHEYTHAALTQVNTHNS